MMQIGDIAAKAGITPRTIRYYQELDLIQPYDRSEGGFRLYSDAQLRRLKVIQSLKDLGLDLEGIRAFFNPNQGVNKGQEVNTGGDMARSMIASLNAQQEVIKQKVTDYQQMHERNARAIEILKECLCCQIRVLERECQKCEIYKGHTEIPDVVDCAVYEAR
jgi:DNA-binding transcriptional MerR regulator